MMRSFMLFCVCLLLAASCKQNALPEELTALEKEVAKNPSNDLVSKLLDLCATWLQEHPDKSPMQKVVLEKQLMVSTEYKRDPNALSALHGLLIDYPDDAKAPDWILQVGDILTKSNKAVAAQVLYRSFVEKYPKHAKASEISAQHPASEQVDSLILNIGRQIFPDTTNTLNQEAARQYVDACEAYAIVNQGNDASAEYLHKASETARTLRSTAKALAIYDWILRAYPNHKRSAQALFLKGFTYDNDLKDYETAHAAYTEFLEKYPNDEFASSAQFLLENLGKSDDELLKALQEKAAQNSQGSNDQSDQGIKK